MRVGILTSWRVPCGIYQYSARYADALKRAGVEPVILAGRADEHRSVPEESEHEVHDVAEIGLWRDDGNYYLKYEDIGGMHLDAVHVQYQSMLFNQAALAAMTYAYRHSYGICFGITFHDNCQRPDFPYNAFDLKFSHRLNVGPPGAEVIPFGIEDRPPVVRTFGLGRSQTELIAPVCERNGWIFESASSHEPIHGGGQSWKSHEELIQWLRGADAIVLWYPDVDQAGSSQAARTAMAARRPVLTNNVKWFEDLPPYVAGIYQKANTLSVLEARLTDLFHRSYVDDNSWDGVAQHMLTRYRAFV